MTWQKYLEFDGSQLKTKNGIVIGEILLDVDGYKNWWPQLRPGYVPSYMLRAIADCVDEMNKSWDDHPS